VRGIPPGRLNAFKNFLTHRYAVCAESLCRFSAVGALNKWGPKCRFCLPLDVKWKILVDSR